MLTRTPGLQVMDASTANGGARAAPKVLYIVPVGGNPTGACLGDTGLTPSAADALQLGGYAILGLMVPLLSEPATATSCLHHTPVISLDAQLILSHVYAAV